MIRISPDFDFPRAFLAAAGTAAMGPLRLERSGLAAWVPLQ